MNKRWGLIPAAGLLRSPRWGVVAVVLASALAYGVLRAASGPPTLQEADRHWADRSYVRALEGYQHALDSGAAGDRQIELEYRVVVALGRSQRWDEALSRARDFIKAHPEGLWGARGNYWLAQLLTMAPHEGYRVGERIYRGSDYPKVATAEKPEQVNLSAQDWTEGRAAFERAKRLYEHLRPEAEREEADLNFDLAQLLGAGDLSPITNALVALALEKDKRSWLRQQCGKPDPAMVKRLRDYDWTPTPTRPYDPDPPFPQRVLTLYEQIEKLDHGRRAPEARLARALYLASYQSNMASMVKACDTKKGEAVAFPFPYQELDIIALVESIAKDYPKHPVAPQAQITAANWLEAKSDFVGALDLYRDLVQRWPQSKWISDARGRIQDIEWPSLTLAASPARPRHNAALGLTGRNVKTVTLTAYRVQLEKLLLRPEILNNPWLSWGSWDAVEEKVWRQGERVASWTYTTTDKGQHKWLSENVTSPLSKLGAYVVEGEAGDAWGACLVLITDLAIVTKSDQDRALVYVCDADSGRPVPGAEVVMREIYQRGKDPHVDVERGQADQDGLKGKPLQRGPGVRSNRVETLAWVGGRYAVTPLLSHETGWHKPYDIYRAYVTTDRPVYRPGQQVNFRVVIAARTVEGEEGQPGSWHAARDLPFEVTVWDPRTQKVHQATLTTNEFGSINGSLTLGQEPTLGVYDIRVRLTSVEPPIAQISGNQFRVEEYKKPEFEVAVTASVDQARVGETVKARIGARYYFGSPVVGAEVKYRVFRAPYSPYYRFPRPYDWLVRAWQGDDYSGPYYGSGEVCKEGTGRTDAQGELTVQVKTEAGGQWPKARAYRYTINAEVTDESRRTITGSGEVRVSRQQYFAFLDLKRGFYQVGDQIELEVATRDVMDRPVAARGAIVVERVVRGGRDLVEAVVHKGAVATDREGRGFFRWVPKQAGQYRFRYQAVDQWKEKVAADIYTWINGPDFDKAAFRLSGIQLIPEKQTYEEGETCRLLIISSFRDSTVLLSQQAGPQIIARSVLPIRGKSHVLEVPIRRGHLPNFYFHAVMVQEWQAREAYTEIFVPPGRQFLNVSVASDRAEYRPGDEATFRLKATDWRGQPARAELSLAVVDASLLYIQQEYAPDPRLWFYGERRSLQLSQNWSFQWVPSSHSVTRRTSQPFRTHEWVWPEDTGHLQDWPPGLGGEQWLGSYRDYEYGPPGPAARASGARAGGGGIPGGGGMGGGGGGGRGGGGYGGGVAGTRFLAAGETDIVGMPITGLAMRKAKAEAPTPESALAAAQTRTRFADTAFWSPSVVTGEDGTATVKVTMPENLTTWRATARGLTTEVQVGQGRAEAVTRKNLIVRLQAPRFFRERDLVVLSANVHNYLTSEKKVKVTLALDGGTLELVKEAPADLGLKEPATEASLWVTVPKDGERRVDWVVRVLRSGTASIRMTAQTDEESDAVEMQFPALVHGAEKFEVQSGVARDVRGSHTITLKLDVPKERRRGATELNLQLTPSLAAVALDALPYLADYPYGCIEQTMSRFLPSVLVARTLTDLGINLDELRKRADAYAKEIEASSGSQAQPDAGYTYPKGMPGSFNAAALASGMYLRRERGPIFDRAELDRMVRDGLNRIYSQQKQDGGWGWWPSDLSDPYMTAYVCYGLFTAREAGCDIDSNALERGFQFLLKQMKEEDNLHLLAYMASVVTLRGSVDDAVKTIISDRLYRNRMKLTPYSQALLALALKQIGDLDKARVLLDNLENTAHVDRENGSADWAPRQRGWWWWHWWDSPAETNAAVLRAYMAIRPDDELAPMIVKWLIANRRGNQWASTKETAMAVYALADYIRVKKELAPDYTITVDLDGKVRRTYRVNRENALFFDNRFIVGDEVIGDGPQTLTITVKGSGTLYYSTYLRYFSLEEDLKGGGHEIFVQRRYFKLTPKLVTKKSNGNSWQELSYDRTELPSGAQLRSGDLVEVELVIDAKNDYEYLVFEDMKPAGCEPVEVRSGAGAGEGAGVYPYLELRDEKVAVFLSAMPQGTRAVRYRLRAEIPGEFHALPTNGYSMYAPDVRCLSDEWRVRIGD